jgi:hypothetical protein
MNRSSIHHRTAGKIEVLSVTLSFLSITITRYRLCAELDTELFVNLYVLCVAFPDRSKLVATIPSDTSGIQLMAHTSLVEPDFQQYKYPDLK